MMEDMAVKVIYLKVAKENLGVKNIASGDKEYQELVNIIRKGKNTTHLPKEHSGRQAAGVFDLMSLMEEDEKTLILIDRVKLFLPEEAAKKLVTEIHEKCHVGPERTISTLFHHYFFPGLRKMVQESYKNYLTSLKHKPAKSKESEVTNSEPIISLQPWEMICLDNFTMNGYHHLLCVNRFSAYLQVSSIGRETTDNIIEALEKMFSLHGFPRP